MPSPNFLREWVNASEASEALTGIRGCSSINAAMQAKRHYAYGYLWVYKGDFEAGVRPWWDKHRDRTLRAVVQLSLAGEFIAEYRSASEGRHAVTGRRKKESCSIGNCLRGRGKTAYGYMWRYKSDYDKDLTIKSIQ